MQPYPTQKTWPSVLLVSCVLMLAIQAPDELWQHLIDWSWSGQFRRESTQDTQTIETESLPKRDVKFLEQLSQRLEANRSRFTEETRRSRALEVKQASPIRLVEKLPSPFRLSSWKTDQEKPLMLAATKRKTKSEAADPIKHDSFEAKEAEQKATDIVETQEETSSSDSSNGPQLELNSPDQIIPDGPTITPIERDRIESVLPESRSVVREEPLRQPAWPDPLSIANQIELLRESVKDPKAIRWLQDITMHVTKLHELETIGDPRATVLIDAIITYAKAGIAATNRTSGDLESSILRRFAFAILRRSEVWKLSNRLDRTADSHTIEPTPHAILPIIDRFEQNLASNSSYRAWADYLKIDRLRTVASDPLGSETTVKRDLAREILRLSDPTTLTSSQHRFLSAADWDGVRSELQRWAVEPVDVTDLLTAVERFELSNRLSDEHYLVNKIQHLGWSPNPNGKALSNLLETHYRNANVRITVTGVLLNRLLPVIQPLTEPVEEDLLGAKVQGSNRTQTQLGIRLIPDDRRIHMQLVANGSTQSMTVSQKGPVKLFNRGESEFNAGQHISIGRRGIFASRARAVASGRTRLLDVKTDYDKIPILGWVVRQIAKDEHDDNRRFVRNHVRNRVSNAAKKRLNDAVGKNLKSAETRVAERLIQPLQELDLDLKAMEMRTTKDRIIVRCRLAGQHQLAAYTPRPRALAGSFMSLQLHQSAINNLLRQVKLANERIELEELMKRLQKKFGVDREDISEEIPEGVLIRLSNGQPIQVEFDNDRVVVSVKISELKTRRRRWKNITVRARYRADAEENHVDLNREGGIELTADRIGFRDQIALRGIFTKVMSSYHRFQVLRGRFENDSRLTKLQITQFVAREGWIGVSIGNPPKDRVAKKAKPQRR